MRLPTGSRRSRLALRVIEEEDVGERPVVTPRRRRPLLRWGVPVLQCGRCDQALADGFRPVELAGLVLRCPVCRSLNDMVG